MAIKGRFFEQPKLYIIMIMFSILIYLLYDQQAGTVLAFLSTAGAIAYFIKKPRLLVNNIKGNTLQSMMFAGIALGLTVLGTILFAFFLGAIKSFDIASFGAFLEFNKMAILGAQTLPFAGNPIFTFIVFIIAFPIVETSVALQLYDFILDSFNVRIDIKDFRNWLVAAMIGTAAIFYHIYAKANVAGGINENVLVIMFMIFFIECLLSSYTKEMESSIYHHILNNALALL